jgi:ankyrin repeat protein
MSVLYGAAGVRQDPELTALLLEYGADPNGEPHFGDALYHAVEAQDTACLKLLLDHGGAARGSNALAHGRHRLAITAPRTPLRSCADVRISSRC